jgi:hypothetical protein
MNYIVTQLITTPQGQEFSLLGQAADKKSAARLAVDSYRAYNKNASAQNLEMMQEWLATRLTRSFRRDRQHRLQLAIIALPAANEPQEKKVAFNCCPAEEDQLLQKISAEIIADGHHTAIRPAGDGTCRVAAKK